MSEDKIDFVVTWVDGNDPEWRKEKNSYLPAGKRGGEDNRYRDWGVFRYWFRGVEKNAPWVNRIYLITCGHYPEWINKDHPRLKLISHRDYIPEEYLPTFNSRPIEFNLYRLQELSNTFVLFNDDLFVTGPIRAEDYFRNGVPCDACGFELLNIKYDPTFYDAIVNNLRVINREFDAGTFIKQNFRKIFNIHYDIKHVKSLLLLPWAKGCIPGFINYHLPLSYRKETFSEVWEREYPLLHETCLHKFRSSQDLNQNIFQYWQFMTGRFIPVNMKKRGLYYSLPDQLDECCKAIERKKHKVTCLNDESKSLSDEEFRRAQEKLIRAFEHIYPEKSSFEL